MIQLIHQPDSDVDGVSVALDVGGEYNELVAADAGDRVVRPNDRCQLLGHGP